MCVSQKHETELKPCKGAECVVLSQATMAAGSWRAWHEGFWVTEQTQGSQHSEATSLAHTPLQTSNMAHYIAQSMAGSTVI